VNDEVFGGSKQGHALQRGEHERWAAANIVSDRFPLLALHQRHHLRDTQRLLVRRPIQPDALRVNRSQQWLGLGVALVLLL
jgi:hypothetical protein